jgi:lipase
LVDQHPFLLIHGLIGSFSKPNFAAALAARLSLSLDYVIAPDLLGYGAESDALAESINIAGQVDYLHRLVSLRFPGRKVNLIGHSVGGAVAMLFAYTFPYQVNRIWNLEGNFTLEDAFWTRSIADKTAAEVELEFKSYRDAPSKWMALAGIELTSKNEEIVATWLNNQPISTIQLMAKSVVEVTGAAEYLEKVEEVFTRKEVFLVAGERSSAGWHVPANLKKFEAGNVLISNSGHMLMIDNPSETISYFSKTLV